MQPTSKLQVINLPLPANFIANIQKLPARIFVVPLQQNIIPNLNYIVNLMDGEKKIVSYIARHTVSTFYSILGTYNMTYSVLISGDYKTSNTIALLNDTVNLIQTQRQSADIPDTYQLSAFTIINEFKTEGEFAQCETQTEPN